MRFRTFYRQQMLLEGGLGGHMAHGFEVLTPEELLSFIDDLTTGKLAASEKVDGQNLFLFAGGKELQFARNRTEGASTDINAKFNMDHPAGDSFRAGFLACQQGFAKLTKAQRSQFLLDKYWLNCEILYGEVPNLIQYSDITNYVVFHGYHEGPEQDFGRAEVTNSKQLLQALAAAIGTQKVTSDVVGYTGTIGKVQKVVDKQESTWTFKGPIDISPEKLHANLQKVADEWRNIPEVKALQNRKGKSEEEVREMMKALSTKVGSKILSAVSSELLTGQKKTGAEHPGIEGLVTNYKGHMLKVTGDFAALNQTLWGPLRDNAVMKSFVQDMLGTVGVNDLTQITKASWGDGARTFLRKKAAKLYKDEKAFAAVVNTAAIKNIITRTLQGLNTAYTETEKQKGNVKQEAILRSLRMASFKVQQLQDALKNKTPNVEQFVTLFAKVMFGL